MASITIRSLDSDVKEMLRVQAARHGRSMEEEARVILRTVLTTQSKPKGNLYDRIHGRFAALGGVDLDLPPREMGREPPRFED